MEQQLLGIKWACQERSESSLGKCDWYPPDGQQPKKTDSCFMLSSFFLKGNTVPVSGCIMCFALSVPRLLTMRDFSDGAGERERERELMCLFVFHFMWTSCIANICKHYQTFDHLIIFANIFPLFSSYGCNWSDMNQHLLRLWGLELKATFSTRWAAASLGKLSRKSGVSCCSWSLPSGKLWQNHAFVRYFVC